MKLLFILLVQVIFVYCQDAKQAVPVSEAERVAAIMKDDSDKYGESPFCIIGTIALPPLPPFKKCKKLNEVYGCAFGEARCDGFGYCGTPPCTWRCWCKNGYKRDQDGNCVKVCPMIATPLEIAFHS